MYIFNRIFNNLVNKICWFLLIAIVGLTCFFLGCYYVDAATCSNFPVNSNASQFTLATPITGTEDFYSHDKIRDELPQLLNQQQTFVDSYSSFTSTYSFYQRFNYAVQQQSDSNYFRIYYQDYQQLKSLNCDNLVNKFYLYAVYTSLYANSGYAYVQYGFMYNFYVDIHIDTSTSQIIFDSMSTPYLVTPAFKTSTSSSFGSTPGWPYYSWNFPFIDSYNNFAIPSSVDDTYKADFFRGVGTYAYNSFQSYPQQTQMIHSTSTPIDDLITQFTGDEVTEDSGDSGEGGEDTGNSVDLKPIEDKLDDVNDNLEDIKEESKNILDAIVDGTASVITGVVDGVSDAISGVVEGINAIIDFITEPFDAEETFGKFFDDFIDNDNGGISGVITSPLRLINSLINDKSCNSLNLPIFNENIPFPSGCMLWDEAPDNVITLWHTLVCGLGSYFLLTSLFKDIENLKHPDESEVSTLDL